MVIPRAFSPGAASIASNGTGANGESGRGDQPASTVVMAAVRVVLP
jgi:hypothetical protein